MKNIKNSYSRKRLSDLNKGDKCTTGIPHMVSYFNMEVIGRNKDGTIKVRYYSSDGLIYKDFDQPASRKVWVKNEENCQSGNGSIC